MRILIFSDACFNDNVFPMYKAMLEKGLEVDCLINLSDLNIGLFDIKKRLSKQAIIPATSYSELQKYQSYVDMSKMYLVNHEVRKRYPWTGWIRTWDIIKFINEGKYDIIHTDILFDGSLKWLYRYKKNLVYVRHDPFPHTGMAFSESMQRNLYKAYRQIPKIVILNHFQYCSFCHYYHLDPKNVLENRLGPLECIKLFVPQKSDVKENNILFFGRIVEYKGIEYLCKAMLKVHECIPNASITIAGGGDFYFDIEPYKQLPYFEFINRYITEEELACLINRSEFTVCPYTDATQSGGVLTSYSLNKPVVATNIPAMQEMVVDGESGILVPPKDADALAKAIVNLLDNKKIIIEMERYIESEYTNGTRSWSSVVDKYVEFYKR